jgi:hypothetical protein
MKGITNLQNVNEKVNAITNQCTDQLVSTQDIEFDNLEVVNIASEPHYVREKAQQLICTRYGIPHSYLNRCSSEVQAMNLNYWLRKEKNENMFLRFYNDDVRAFFTPRYKPADNHEVLSRLCDYGFAPETKVQCYLDEDFMSVNIPDESKTFGIARNDKIVPGISISNSETGFSALKIETYFLRLICTNGMITKTQISSSFRHISLKVLSEFPQLLSAASYNFDTKKQQFKLSMESRVDNPAATIKSFNRQFLLSELEVKAVEWGWEYEAGMTMFNIVNSYTRAAEYKLLPAESSYKLQRVGGNILSLLK